MGTRIIMGTRIMCPNLPKHVVPRNGITCLGRCVVSDLFGEMLCTTKMFSILHFFPCWSVN